MIEDGNVVIGFGGVEPEVDGKWLAPVVGTDVAAEKASVRLVEEDCLPGDTVAKDRRLDDCPRHTRGRRGRQREFRGVVMLRHACLEFGYLTFLVGCKLRCRRSPAHGPEFGQRIRRQLERARFGQVAEFGRCCGVEGIVRREPALERHAQRVKRGQTVPGEQSAHRGLGFGRRVRERRTVRGFAVCHERCRSVDVDALLVARPGQGRTALDTAEAGRIVAGFVVAVEKRAQLVVLALTDRVVAVVVAARAAKREAHERRAERVVGSLDHVLDLVFSVDRAVLRGTLADAKECRCEQLLFGGVRKQVAGKLPRSELVERHVAVECFDYPVAPRPQEPVVMVIEKSIGVAPTREVEPIARHVFGVTRRFEQTIDELPVGVGARIRDEGVDLVERRRQASQRQADPVDQRFAIGLRRRRHAFAFETGKDVRVDPVDGAIVETRARRRHVFGRQERPVALVFGAVGDPLTQNRLFAIRQGLVGRHGRHHIVLIRSVDAPDQFAAVGIPRHDRVALARSFKTLKRELRRVEPKAGLASFRVRAVALEAVLRKDRPDVPVVADVLRYARDV